MKKISLPAEQVELLITTITNRIGTCSVYCFGYRPGERHQFFLLVLSPKAVHGLAVNMANAIAEKSGNAMRATILLHKPKDLASKLPHQQYFFDWRFQISNATLVISNIIKNFLK